MAKNKRHVSQNFMIDNLLQSTSSLPSGQSGTLLQICDGNIQRPRGLQRFVVFPGHAESAFNQLKFMNRQ